MTYGDDTFDMVFDKGTIDALINHTNYDNTDKVLREMARVTKKDGSVIEITYGNPLERCSCFKSAIGFEKFNYFITKKSLS